MVCIKNQNEQNIICIQNKDYEVINFILTHSEITLNLPLSIQTDAHPCISRRQPEKRWTQTLLKVVSYNSNL